MPNRDMTPTQGSGAKNQQLDWAPEESYWRDNWSKRPYASADRGFEYYQPGYRYGFESANRYHGRNWDDVESDLRTQWASYAHRGQSKWEHVKGAIRDGWNRVVNR